MSEFEVKEPCPVCGKTDKLSLIPCILGAKYGDDVLCTRCLCKISAKNWNTRSDGWISVDDRLPDFNADILFTTKDGVRIGRLYRSSHKFISNFDKFYKQDVTHWQPLPTPPQTK